MANMCSLFMMKTEVHKLSVFWPNSENHQMSMPHIRHSHTIARIAHKHHTIPHYPCVFPSNTPWNVQYCLVCGCARYAFTVCIRSTTVCVSACNFVKETASVSIFYLQKVFCICFFDTHSVLGYRSMLVRMQHLSSYRLFSSSVSFRHRFLPAHYN